MSITSHVEKGKEKLCKFARRIFSYNLPDAEKNQSKKSKTTNIYVPAFLVASNRLRKEDDEVSLTSGDSSMSDKNGSLLSLRFLCSTIEKHNHSHSRFLGRQPEQQLRRRRDINMLNFSLFILCPLKVIV